MPTLSVTHLEKPIKKWTTKMVMSIDYYQIELKARYRSSCGGASSRKRWEKECRKFGWKYEQRQWIDNTTCVIWQFTDKYKYKKKVFEIIEVSE